MSLDHKVILSFLCNHRGSANRISIVSCSHLVFRFGIDNYIAVANLFTKSSTQSLMTVYGKTLNYLVCCALLIWSYYLRVPLQLSEPNYSIRKNPDLLVWHYLYAFYYRLQDKHCRACRWTISRSAQLFPFLATPDAIYDQYPTLLQMCTSFGYTARRLVCLKQSGCFTWYISRVYR